MQLGDRDIDLEARTVRGGGVEATLTPLEAKLLGFLEHRRGEIVSRGELLTAVWGYNPRSVSRAVDHVVYRLRRKIEPTPDRPRWLLSARSGGYRLELPPIEESAGHGESSSFVGRSAERTTIEQALGKHNAVQVSGDEGMGKTRLAQRIALGWPGGAILVSARAISDRPTLLHRMARALGVPDDQVFEALANLEEPLLVIDEVDALPDEALVELLEPTTPVLFTSRRRIRGVPNVTLEGLPGRDAAHLVRVRTPQTLSPAQITSIVETSGGVPLALELLANADPSNKPKKQPGLATALEMAWHELDEPGRQLVRIASQFTGSFALGDLEELVGDDVLTTLADVATRGWLKRVETQFLVPGAVRRFIEREGWSNAAGHHERWLLGWAPTACRQLRQHWESAVHERLERFEDDLRHAVARTDDPDVAVPLLLAIHRPGPRPPAAVLAEIERVVQLVAPTSGWTCDLHVLCATHLATTNPLPASLHLDRAMDALPYTHQDKAVGLLASIRGVRAGLLARTGPDEASRHLYAEAIAGHREAGDPTAAGRLCAELASVTGRIDPEAGIARGLEALETLARVGNPFALSEAHTVLAELHQSLEPGSPLGAEHHGRALALLETTRAPR